MAAQRANGANNPLAPGISHTPERVTRSSGRGNRSVPFGPIETPPAPMRGRGEKEHPGETDPKRRLPAQRDHQ